MTTDTGQQVIRQLRGPTEAAKEAVRTELATLAALVVAAPLDLTEVTQEFVYDLPTPIRLSGYRRDRRLERVRVRISRWPHPTHPADVTGETVIHGYTRTVNTNGRPRRGGLASWEALPTAELSDYARALIVRALTEA
jgi:hypothetical protein